MLPEQDVVLAITSGLKDMQAVLNLVWDQLLPALHPDPLAADAAAQRRLADKLATLALPCPTGTAAPPLVARMIGRRFAFAANDQKLEVLTLEAGTGGETTLVARSDGQEQRIACSFGHWKKSRAAFGKWPERAVAASGAWASDDTWVGKLCFYETPSTLTVRLRFAGDEVTLESEFNVAFGPTKLPTITGRAD